MPLPREFKADCGANWAVYSTALRTCAAGLGLETAGQLNSHYPTIREALRHATSDAHDELDRTLGTVDLSDRESYAAFLTVQFVTRAAVERWVADHAPRTLQPPVQTPLILRDLTALGRSDLTFAERPLVAPAAGALGVAWAIGGSSLGNRFMLAKLRKNSLDLPDAFLSDREMPVFFARLRPALEGNADRTTGAAVAAATAVFTAFTEAAEAVVSLDRAA